MRRSSSRQNLKHLRVDWLLQKLPFGFAPHVRMYPPRLPRGYDLSQETRILVHPEDGIVTHPSIVKRCPDLPRETMPPGVPALRPVVVALEYVWGLNKHQIMGYLAHWVIKPGRRVDDRRWRNPTYKDVAIVAGVSVSAVRSFMSVFMRTKDGDWQDFLDGKTSYYEIKKNVGKDKITKLLPVLYGAHDRRTTREGDVLGADDFSNPAPCVECRRIPRMRRSRVGFGVAYGCSRMYSEVECGYVHMYDCSRKKPDYHKTKADAVNAWNAEQKRLKDEKKKICNDNGD